MGKASSAKKVARASRAGGQKKVRNSQGLVFPIALGLVVFLGLGLIFYARQSQPASSAEPPTVNDHFHTAYGVYACDKWLAPVQNTNDAIDGTPIGIHTHGDGVIHVHPFNSIAAGKNAKLSVFFKTSGIKMSNTKLEMPENLGTYTNGDDCNGKPASLKVLVWDDANSTSDPKIYVTDFGNIRLDHDRAALTIAFVNDDADLKTLKPTSIPTLDKLSDVGSPSTATTVPGASTVPGETTVPGATTVPGTAANSADTTATPATTAAATSTSAG